MRREQLELRTSVWSLEAHENDGSRRRFSLNDFLRASCRNDNPDVAVNLRTRRQLQQVSVNLLPALLVFNDTQQANSISSPFWILVQQVPLTAA